MVRVNARSQGLVGVLWEVYGDGRPPQGGGLAGAFFRVLPCGVAEDWGAEGAGQFLDF